MVKLINLSELKNVDPKKAQRIENLRKANRPSNGKQTRKVSMGYKNYSFI